MYQSAWIYMCKLLSNLKIPQPLSLLLVPLNVPFSDTIIPDSGKKVKIKKLVTSDHTSKQCIYITFYICRKCLKRTLLKTNVFLKKKQQKHPVFLCSSAVLIANTNIIYFQSYVFLIFMLCLLRLHWANQFGIKVLHTRYMNLDVFSSLFVLGKAIAKPLSSYQS